MEIISFEDFMKEYNSKNFTMSESESQKSHKNYIDPSNSKIYSDKGFI